MNITDCVLDDGSLELKLDLTDVDLGEAEACAVMIKATASNGNEEHDSIVVWANGYDYLTTKHRELYLGELDLSEGDGVELTLAVHACRKMTTAAASLSGIKPRKTSTATAPLLDAHGIAISQVTFTAEANTWQGETTVVVSAELDQPDLDGPWRTEAARADQNGHFHTDMTSRLGQWPASVSFETARKGLDSSTIELRLTRFIVDDSPLVTQHFKPEIRSDGTRADWDDEDYDDNFTDTEDDLDDLDEQVSFDSDIAQLDLPEDVEYLLALKGQRVHSAICYKIVDGDVYGAFYGYTGGGTYDDGKFRIVKGDAEAATGGASEEFASNPVEEEHYAQAIKAIWQLVRQPIDGEGEVYPTTAAQRLVKSSRDRISSTGFDGDILSDVSFEWPLFLKF